MNLCHHIISVAQHSAVAYRSPMSPLDPMHYILILPSVPSAHSNIRCCCSSGIRPPHPHPHLCLMKDYRWPRLELESSCTTNSPAAPPEGPLNYLFKIEVCTKWLHMCNIICFAWYHLALLFIMFFCSNRGIHIARQWHFYRAVTRQQTPSVFWDCLCILEAQNSKFWFQTCSVCRIRAGEAPQTGHIVLWIDKSKHALVGGMIILA